MITSKQNNNKINFQHSILMATRIWNEIVGVNHGYSHSQQQVLKGLYLCHLTSCVLPIDPFNPTIYESNNALKLVMQFPKIDKQYGLSNNYCSIFFSFSRFFGDC